MKIQVAKDTEIIVVGDIHEHKDQFDNLLKEVKPSSHRLLVSVGDIYDKGQGREAGDKITDMLSTLHQQGYAYVVKGNHELKLLKKSRKCMTNELQWWSKQPLSLTFEFDHGQILTVVHGGILPSHSWSDLEKDISLCYVRDLDEYGKMIKLKWIEEKGKKVLIPEKLNGSAWHHVYDGRFGYVASGHQPQKDGKAKFYNYSCNLDSAVYVTGRLTAQIFNFSGLGELLVFDGKAYGKEDGLSLS